MAPRPCHLVLRDAVNVVAVSKALEIMAVVVEKTAVRDAMVGAMTPSGFIILVDTMTCMIIDSTLPQTMNLMMK